ncbi:MAG: helix-hairpin-helix domain-containing protein [Flammeovirgaceae bacterium]|nr:helix-hairpin-helix domain-containing protein [Flammeovirgaceae bacterium]
MNKIKNWIQSYFSFSSRETNGFVILVIIMAILLVSPVFTRLLMENSSDNWDNDIEKLNILAAQLEPQLIAKKEKSTVKYHKYKPAIAKDIKYFSFNPNTIGLTDWENFGIATYLGKRILKYVEKGGSFKIKSDLKKIYGFPEAKYMLLEPYINLPEAFTKKDTFKKDDKKTSTSNTYFEKKPFEITSFDINKADTTDLKQIRGIGSKLSARIIKFRNKLGGFHEVQQIKDVYGLKEEVYLSLIEHVRIEESYIQKININQADEAMLKSHPYIDWKLAKIIINYRNQHGKYSSIEDLKNIKIVTEEFATKMLPYLSFEP